jgi:hypothetical protein
MAYDDPDGGKVVEGGGANWHREQRGMCGATLGMPGDGIGTKGGERMARCRPGPDIGD